VATVMLIPEILVAGRAPRPQHTPTRPDVPVVASFENPKESATTAATLAFEKVLTNMNTRKEEEEEEEDNI
jgi:hypothetical protein